MISDFKFSALQIWKMGIYTLATEKVMEAHRKVYGMRLRDIIFGLLVHNRAIEIILLSSF